MKKTITVCILLAAAIAVFGAENRITVSGTGKVAVKPDKAVISLAVNTRDKNAAAAAAENAAKMSAVQDAIMKAGIGKDSFSTNNYSIWQESSYKDGVRINGDYQVSNNIVVTIKDLDAVGSIIDRALEAGANQMNSLMFKVSDSSEAVTQARILAVQNAHEAAQTLTKAAGRKLGKAVEISEGGNMRYDAPTMVMNAAKGERYETPVNAGYEEITASVTITYLLN